LWMARLHPALMVVKGRDTVVELERERPDNRRARLFTPAEDGECRTRVAPPRSKTGRTDSELSGGGPRAFRGQGRAGLGALASVAIG
jgi:hypothetical protein